MEGSDFVVSAVMPLAEDGGAKKRRGYEMLAWIP